jgi:hypothetical protein
MFNNITSWDRFRVDAGFFVNVYCVPDSQYNLGCFGCQKTIKLCKFFSVEHSFFISVEHPWAWLYWWKYPEKLSNSCQIAKIVNQHFQLHSYETVLKIVSRLSEPKYHLIYFLTFLTKMVGLRFKIFWFFLKIFQIWEFVFIG